MIESGECLSLGKLLHSVRLYFHCWLGVRLSGLSVSLQHLVDGLGPVGLVKKSKRGFQCRNSLEVEFLKTCAAKVC